MDQFEKWAAEPDGRPTDLLELGRCAHCQHSISRTRSSSHPDWASDWVHLEDGLAACQTAPPDSGGSAVESGGETG